MFIARVNHVNSNPVTLAAIARQQAKNTAPVEVEISDEEKRLRNIARVEQERQERIRRMWAKTQRMIDEHQFSAENNLNGIVARVCWFYEVRVEDLIGDNRKRRYALARQAVCYWARQFTKLSMPQISRALGGRDHTTILHGQRSYLANKEKAKARKRANAARDCI